MPVNPDAVGLTSEPTERAWSSKDSLLYALGVGAGMDDPTGAELEFTTENSIGVTQSALPTMAVVLPSGGPDMSKLGRVDMTQLLHGDQTITLHREIPVEGCIRSTSNARRNPRRLVGVVSAALMAAMCVESTEGLPAGGG